MGFFSFAGDNLLYCGSLLARAAAEEGRAGICRLLYFAHLGWQDNQVNQPERPGCVNGLFSDLVSGLPAH